MEKVVIEGKVELGGAVIAVQDEQVMVYFPDDTGTSVPLDECAVIRLMTAARLASVALRQKKKRG